MPKSTARIEVIVGLLNHGIRRATIARSLGLSRERVRQIVRDDVDWDLLAIPCDWCGLVMLPKWGLRHSCHEDCAVDRERERTSHYKEGEGLRHWHQRNRPDGEFEAEALRQYKLRGYNICWAPNLAPFDYLVNGYIIDVKGAHLDGNGRWQFGTRHSGDSMAERCDIVHCIGLADGKHWHFIMPAEAVGTRRSIAILPPTGKYVCAACGAAFQDRKSVV